MEVICFALGMIIGGALCGVAAYFFAKFYKSKKEIFDAEEKKAELRRETQWRNFVAYDGTDKGQEAID